MLSGSSGPSFFRWSLFISFRGSPPSGSVIPSEVRSRVPEADLGSGFLRSWARCLNSCTTARPKTQRHTRTASPSAMLVRVSQIVSESKSSDKCTSAADLGSSTFNGFVCEHSIVEGQGKCQSASVRETSRVLEYDESWGIDSR